MPVQRHPCCCCNRKVGGWMPGRAGDADDSDDAASGSAPSDGSCTTSTRCRHNAGADGDGAGDHPRPAGSGHEEPARFRCCYCRRFLDGTGPCTATGEGSNPRASWRRRRNHWWANGALGVRGRSRGRSAHSAEGWRTDPPAGTGGGGACGPLAAPPAPRLMRMCRRASVRETAAGRGGRPPPSLRSRGTSRCAGWERGRSRGSWLRACAAGGLPRVGG
mmetsp:Transcript_1531/g.3799  ORF Transcript_1531/g.3799 Transcript_1531/m.3799 type:complete len:219 (-) Transcript_1531:308-964(-)